MGDCFLLLLLLLVHNSNNNTQSVKFLVSPSSSLLSAGVLVCLCRIQLLIAVSFGVGLFVTTVERLRLLVLVVWCIVLF